MNKVYEKPWIEIEYYTLDASIAANCSSTVTLGPGDYKDNVCSEFDGAFDISLYSRAKSSATFYDGITGDECDCYYSSGGEGYFTS